ncbi:hypothetical protein Hte_010539 [Hypoxylon texense]
MEDPPSSTSESADDTLDSPVKAGSSSVLTQVGEHEQVCDVDFTQPNDSSLQISENEAQISSLNELNHWVNFTSGLGALGPTGAVNAGASAINDIYISDMIQVGGADYWQKSSSQFP